MFISRISHRNMFKFIEFPIENVHFWGFPISSGPKTDISTTFQDRQSRVNFEEPDWGFVGWTIKTWIGRNTQILKLGWNGLEELFSILIDIFLDF